MPIGPSSRVLKGALMSTGQDDLLNTNRLYAVEVKLARGRWQAKGSTRLKPGVPTQPEAERLAKIHKADVRLVLVHPAPPSVCLVEVSLANMSKKGALVE